MLKKPTIAQVDAWQPPPKSGFNPFIEGVLQQKEETDFPFDMDDELQDPCPECDGPMKVGDYVCWGFCYQCFKSAGGEQPNPG